VDDVRRAPADAGNSRLRAAIDALLDPHVVFEAVRDDAGAIVDFRYADANAAACAYNGLSRRDLLGTRLLRRLPGVREPGLFAAYCRVVETGEPLVLDGTTYRSDLAGAGQPYYDIRGAKLGDGLSVTWRDVTDRHLLADVLRAQRDLAVALGDAQGLPEALDLVMEAALALPGVDCGGVYLVDPDAGDIDLAVHAGLPPEFIAAVSHFAADARQTRVLMAGVSVFASYEDLARELRAWQELQEGLRAFAAVPIRHDGVIIAGLNVASHWRDGFSRQESVLIETLAAQAGGTLARLRADAALREELARLRAALVAAGEASGGARG